MLAIVKNLGDAFSPIFRPAAATIGNVIPGSWAGPQNPIRPTVQLGVGIRGYDFTPAINLQFTPRGDQAVKFPQLWNVSNSFDLCRLMIEKRKNAISQRKWAIRVKPLPGETKKARLQREGTNPNVKRITQLLQFPDGFRSFDVWIRMFTEQMLVFDAGTIFPVLNMLGEPLALRLISGTTITPLLDQFGFTPQPPDPAYQQIILGIPTSNLAAAVPGGQQTKGWTANEIVYAPKNPRVDSRWGFGPVEQIIITLSIAANRQQFLRDFYVSGNVPEGLCALPESWTLQQIKDFQKWFDSILAGNLKMKRRIMFIPDTKREPTMTKTEALTDATDDYLNRLVAFAFGESPQPLVKQVGHQSTAKEGNDQAQAAGLDSDLFHIASTMNGILLRVFKADDVEFAWQDDEEIDPVKSAQVSDVRLKNGSITINEDREARGEDPRPEPEADMLGTITASGWMPLEANAAAERSQQLNPAEPGDDPNKAPKGGGDLQVKVAKRAPLKIVAGDLTPRSRQARNDATRMMQKFLADQKLRISKQAREAFAARKVRKDDTETDTDRALAILAMLKFDYPTLYGQILPYLEIAAEDGAQTGAYQMAAHGGSNLRETLETAVQKAKDAAGDRAAELVGLKVEDDGTLAEATAPAWAMSTTAQDDVLNAIKQALKEEWTPDQLEAVIQASTVFSADHGAMIVDNEITRQQSNGHLISWMEAKRVTKYQWMVMPGCCPLCESFALLGPVPVGYQFAPHITAPGAHPFCRCWLLATEYEGD